MIEKRLKELVAFKTTPDNTGDIERCFDWIVSELSSLPLVIEKTINKGVVSLIVTTQKTKTPTVWLAAHIDVVPADDSQFSPIQKESKLYGRGTFDMKFAVACYIELLHELKDMLASLNVGLMLTSDEEVGGIHGTQFLLDEGYGAEVAILPDSGNNWKFEYAAKGGWWLTIRSTGTSAHASRPWLGENAIDSLMQYLTELKAFSIFQGSPQDTYEIPTLNIGKIIGGEATNQVARSAEAHIDIRYARESDRKAIEDAANELIKKYKNIELITEHIVSSYEFDPTSRYFTIFKDIAKQECDTTVENTKAYGSSDARFLAEKNIPTLVISPIGGNHHSKDEWIDVEDLKRYYKVLRKYVISVAQTQNQTQTSLD